MSEVEKTTADSTTLFDKLYEGAKDLIKKTKKPIISNQLKRSFHAAYDDAERQKDEAELAIQNARADLEKFDLNKIIESRQRVIACKEIQEIIKEEFKLMFNEEMKINL